MRSRYTRISVHPTECISFAIPVSTYWIKWSSRDTPVFSPRLFPGARLKLEKIVIPHFTIIQKGHLTKYSNCTNSYNKRNEEEISERQMKVTKRCTTCTCREGGEIVVFPAVTCRVESILRNGARKDRSCPKIFKVSIVKLSKSWLAFPVLYSLIWAPLI